MYNISEYYLLCTVLVMLVYNRVKSTNNYRRYRMYDNMMYI